MKKKVGTGRVKYKEMEARGSIVIPKEFRNILGVESGQAVRLEIDRSKGYCQIVISRPVDAIKSMLKGETEND